LIPFLADHLSGLISPVFSRWRSNSQGVKRPKHKLDHTQIWCQDY
jgi:hypothetical protein